MNTVHTVYGDGRMHWASALGLNQLQAGDGVGYVDLLFVFLPTGCIVSRECSYMRPWSRTRYGPTQLPVQYQGDTGLKPSNFTKLPYQAAWMSLCHRTCTCTRTSPETRRFVFSGLRSTQPILFACHRHDRSYSYRSWVGIIANVKYHICSAMCTTSG